MPESQAQPGLAVPLLHHDLDSPSAFTPERLMAAVRAERGLEDTSVPPLCVLDFDGDVSDYLAATGVTSPWPAWACFHTAMRVATLAGISCGIVPRTIGGPYAVLVAEQLHAAGARLIVGLTSAGRVSASLPLPSVVVADQAVRDEGTSLHYLPASPTIATPTPGAVELLTTELRAISPQVHRGCVWTTDAPYRETAEQIEHWARRGVLAVEMQAASLFAFGAARGAHVAEVALVSNGADQSAGGFDTGGIQFQAEVLTAIARAAGAFLSA